MKHRLSSREQQTLLLAGGLTVLFLWIYTAYWVGPLLKKMSAFGQQVKEAEGQIDILQRNTTSLAALKEEYRRVNGAVSSFRESLPDLEELPAVIELLSNLASQTDVKIQTIFPQRPAIEGKEGKGGKERKELKNSGNDASGTQAEEASKPAVYAEIPIQVDALAGYHQLGNFLSLAEFGEHMIQVSSLQISENPKNPRSHFVKVIIQSYFATQGAVTTSGLFEDAAGSKP